MRGQSRSRLHAVTEGHDVVGAPASCLAEGAVAPNQGAIHHILSEADHGPATRACFRLQDAKGLTSPDVAVLHLHLGAGPTGIDLAAGMRQRQPSVGLVLLTWLRRRRGRHHGDDLDPHLIAARRRVVG